jgi:hypothetical protein
VLTAAKGEDRAGDTEPRAIPLGKEEAERSRLRFIPLVSVLGVQIFVLVLGLGASQHAANKHPSIQVGDLDLRTL